MAQNITDKSKMKKKAIIDIQGSVQMVKREWWQLYKKGWYKHSDLWGQRWWIRFQWPMKSSYDNVSSKSLAEAAVKENEKYWDLLRELSKQATDEAKKIN